MQPCLADSEIDEHFAKYDLDGSGSMNSQEEIRQLTTSLLISVVKTKAFTVRRSFAVCRILIQDVGMYRQQTSVRKWQHCLRMLR